MTFAGDRPNSIMVIRLLHGFFVSLALLGLDQAQPDQVEG
jgi:hypothetical protein